MSGATREFSRAQIACGSVLLLVSTFYAGVAITRISPQVAQAAAGERTNAQRHIMFSHESDDAHDGNDDFEIGLKVIGIARPLRENGAPAAMARFAFATAVLSDDYVPGACVLAYSLFRTGTLHRMVALVFNDLRADRRQMLQACGWDLVQIKRIRNPNKGSFGAYNQDNYSKLRAWLLPFRRVIFLDADMIVARSLDHLFEEDVSAAAASAPTELTAANDCLYSSTYPDIEFFNSGMMLLTPSAREFANMTRLMHVLPSYTGGDQGFLNSYFRGRRVRRLPIAYNFMRMHEGDKTAFERYAAANANVIKVYHFTGTKPWECGPREECCLNRSPEECADSRFESPTFHSLWWKTYAQMAQDDESGGAVAARRLVVRRWQQVDL